MHVGTLVSLLLLTFSQNGAQLLLIVNRRQQLAIFGEFGFKRRSKVFKLFKLFILIIDRFLVRFLVDVLDGGLDQFIPKSFLKG